MLSFDLRGHGESKTDSVDVRARGFWRNGARLMEYDVQAAYRFLVSRPDIDVTRIGIIGASCGVSYAAGLAKADNNIKAMILLSGGVSPQGLAYVQSNKQLALFGIAAEDDDNGTMAEEIRKLLKASSNPESIEVIFKTGGHGTRLFSKYDWLEYRITHWLATQLLKKS